MNSQYSSVFRKIQSGFTLIEILIAIAIIGVLASIAIPAYQDYKEKMKVNQAISDITTIAVKAEAYWNDERAYPNSLDDIGMASTVDPWGNSYIYLNLYNKKGKGGNRKDKNLNPLNSDFDLFSMGKNGTFKTQITNKDSLDDIIRANDGGFIDLAAKY